MMIRQTLFASVLIIIATAATTDALYYGESFVSIQLHGVKIIFSEPEQLHGQLDIDLFQVDSYSSGCGEATAFGVSCPPPINVK